MFWNGKNNSVQKYHLKWYHIISEKISVSNKNTLREWWSSHHLLSPVSLMLFEFPEQWESRGTRLGCESILLLELFSQQYGEFYCHAEALHLRSTFQLVFWQIASYNFVRFQYNFVNCSSFVNKINQQSFFVPQHCHHNFVSSCCLEFLSNWSSWLFPYGVYF